MEIEVEGLEGERDRGGAFFLFKNKYIFIDRRK